MVALVMLALPACHAGVGVGPAVPTAGDFLVVERAETGPITALAAKAPYLWAAGAPGSVPLATAPVSSWLRTPHGRTANSTVHQMTK